MAVDFQRIGGGIDGEFLPGIVLPHGGKQLFADAPAVIGGVYKEAPDVLGGTGRK